ncbi:unnamed protein product [Vitrella brassicaformis CCMP3155]|uniref:Uncharacterized protein n=1 Tax=Vitrella brassicaformis (strain CCMP3155) TaxID=1169540 RepID=A0A0G4EPH1_VITBC|nr:unnamed protein product [Vitrella brassicaformis CCMP3155]|eukprot:CEL99155.1 unnamed protein product [Vitrella brassicaformis CCMP3155]
MAANKPKLKKEKIVCQMRPLRECLADSNGDITKCIPEINEFERTCSKKVEYVHDRDGLDDTRSGLFSGQKDATQHFTG